MQDDAARFEQIVAILGNKRAWDESGERFPLSSIRVNNTKLPCESKVYEGGFKFKSGVFASNKAKENFFKLDPEGLYLELVNDLISLRQDSNLGWVESTKQDPNTLITNRSAFEQWKQLKQSGKNDIDLEDWLTTDEAKAYQEFAITAYQGNDKLSLESREVITESSEKQTEKENSPKPSRTDEGLFFTQRGKSNYPISTKSDITNHDLTAEGDSKNKPDG